jgi:hypothetical protein
MSPSNSTTYQTIKPGQPAVIHTRNEEYDGLEIDVHSMRGGIDSNDHHTVPQGPLIGMAPILMYVQYTSFSTPLIPQLQLWHLPWLVSVQPVGNSAHKCCTCYNLRFTDAAAIEPC